MSVTDTLNHNYVIHTYLQSQLCQSQLCQSQIPSITVTSVTLTFSHSYRRSQLCQSHLLSITVTVSHNYINHSYCPLATAHCADRLTVFPLATATVFINFWLMMRAVQFLQIRLSVIALLPPCIVWVSSCCQPFGHLLWKPLLSYVMICCAVLWYALLFCDMLFSSVICYVILRYTVLYCDMILWYAVMFCVILGSAVLFCDTLCYSVICRVVLHVPDLLSTWVTSWTELQSFSTVWTCRTGSLLDTSVCWMTDTSRSACCPLCTGFT